MFIFLVTPVDTLNCYYFESNVSLINKACHIVLKPSKHKEITFPHEFLFVFIPFIIRMILLKNIVEKWGLEQKV